MSIRTQLILLVLVPLLCAMSAVGAMVYSQRVTSLAAKATAQVAPLAAELNDFTLFLQEPSPGSGKPAQYYLQATRNRISSLTTGLTPLLTIPDERPLLEQLNTTPERLSKILNQSTHGSTTLSARGAALLTQEIRTTLPVIDQLTSLYKTNLLSEQQRISQISQLLLLAGTIWPVLFSLLLYRSLAHPLARLKDAVAAVTRGELSFRLAASGGELGRLSSAFNKMVESRQKAEGTAKASEERLKDVFENLKMLTVCLEPNGAVSYCNDYLLQIIGRTRQELIGKNWFDLCTPDAEHTKEQFRRMVEKGEIISNVQDEILTKTGKRRLISWNNTLTRDANGSIIGITCIGSDISEQAATEHSQEQNRQALRSLIDGYPESLFLIDRNGTVLTANSTFARRTGKEISHVIGSTLNELFDADIAQGYTNKIEQVFTSNLPLVYDDTHGLWRFEHQLNPVRNLDGSVDSVAILSVDITDRSRIEDELHKANEQLRQNNEELVQRADKQTAELSRLNQELDRTRDDAESANRSKSEFLANMSHEIRTPMNAILGLVHLALQTKLTNKQREYLDTVNSSAQSLLGIINDILDVSRIESGRLELEKTDFSLEGVVSRSIALLAMKARGKGVVLEQQLAADIPDSLVGDPLRLEQVLVNLLGNAVKFTDKGTIRLEITKGTPQIEPDQFQLAVSISDTGIGMDQETISRLFKPFAQGDTSTTRTHSGTGLGLTICRHLIEMMGGAITVTSTPGQGSCFNFTALFGIGTAVVRRTVKADRGLLVRQFQSLQGLRLLVAEDHPVNRQIAQELLEAVGIQTETASNGREALELMLDHGDTIDLILMDIQMPVMDGYEATHEIRRRYSRNRLPIIAMTAHASNEERERCLASGMNEHLTKPIAVEKLYELISRLTDRPPETAPDSEPLETYPQPDITFPEQLPGINIEPALNRVNGNKRLLLQLIQLFAQEHRGISAEIKHLLEEQDLASAARQVHGLKGVAGNLAAERLHIAATNLETALKSQDAVAAQALLPLFEAALQEVCTTADTLADSSSATDTAIAGSPPTEIGPLLSELQHLFEIHSLNVSDQLHQLRTLLPNGDDRIQLDALADAAQRLDYQKALLLLHTLAEKVGTCKENL